MQPSHVATHTTNHTKRVHHNRKYRGTRRYTTRQRHSIAHAHNMLSTTSKNYASIGRKIRSFTPSTALLPTSNTMLGKHAVELMKVLRNKNRQTRTPTTSSCNQIGGGIRIKHQNERKSYIGFLNHM
jgi:hypothetical protein